jgi:hypothetical protein
MSFELNSSFRRREEWKEAHLTEVEFAEMARTLKTLAGELGQDADPVITRLAEKGLDAALSEMTSSTDASVEALYLRARARGRAQ